MFASHTCNRPVSRHSVCRSMASRPSASARIRPAPAPATVSLARERRTPRHRRLRRRACRCGCPESRTAIPFAGMHSSTRGWVNDADATDDAAGDGISHINAGAPVAIVSHRAVLMESPEDPGADTAPSVGPVLPDHAVNCTMVRCIEVGAPHAGAIAACSSIEHLAWRRMGCTSAAMRCGMATCGRVAARKRARMQPCGYDPASHGVEAVERPRPCRRDAPQNGMSSSSKPLSAGGADWRGAAAGGAPRDGAERSPPRSRL